MPNRSTYRFYSGDPPCHGCRDRNETCHATCEKYKAYRQSRDEVYEARMENKKLFDYVADSFKRINHTEWKNKSSKRRW